MAHRLIEKQVIYDGKKVRLEVHHLEDDQGRRYTKEICVHPGAVVVLPFLDERTVLLIRNWRYGIGQMLVELPAGTLEKNEDPMNCAGRELLEETGHLAGRLRLIGSFYTSPGILTEKIFAFAAYDLEKSVARPEVDEEIVVLPTPFEQALEMIRDGEIVDGKTIATLMLFDRYCRSDKQ